MGAQGLRELAERNVEIAHYAADRLVSGRYPAALSPVRFFNEFTVESSSVPTTIEAAERRGVLAGVALGRDYPELDGCLLICVTEMNDTADIDLLCEAVKGA